MFSSKVHGVQFERKTTTLKSTLKKVKFFFGNIPELNNHF